jgi:hypothetical protein
MPGFMRQDEKVLRIAAVAVAAAAVHGGGRDVVAHTEKLNFAALLFYSF